jgi:LmbE family N-acetylglucosaminyl deacetylase
MSSSRRNFVKNAGAGLGLLSLPNIFTNSKSQDKKFKVVCVGGHPDDPESGCGGTLARFVSAGHAVTIIYLTSGEAGIPGKSHDEAAAIRTKEAREACKILQTKPVFAGQIDGSTIVNGDWIKKLQELVAAEAPDIVFTHWPIDSHPDHQAASLLTIQTWMRSNKPFDLYFFEVCQGSQTMTFRPTDFVDISATQDQKKKAVYCHVSQNAASIYEANDCNHALMEKFRGAEIGVTAAEGFVRMTGRKNGMVI